MIAGRIRTLAGGLALLLAAAPAWGQSAGDKANVAEALFRDAVALFEAGRTHEACEKFVESFRLDPANGTLQNVALCHEREGKIASAWAELSQLAGRAAQAGQKDREQMARSHAADLERRVSRVRLSFAANAGVSEVLIDGQVLGRPAWSTPLPLDPGDHAFTFRGEGRAPMTRTVAITGEGMTVPVEVAPLAEDETRAPVLAESHGNGRRTLAWIAAGVGLAGVGVGVGFGVDTFAAKSAGDARCTGRFCTAEGLHYQDRAHTSATVSTVAIGAGVAVLALGTYLFLTSKDPEPAHAGTGAARVSLAVVPTFGEGASGGALSGSF